MFRASPIERESPGIPGSNQTVPLPSRRAKRPSNWKWNWELSSLPYPSPLLFSPPSPSRFGILDGIEAPSFALLADHARLSSGFDETSVSCWSLRLLPPLFFGTILSIDPFFCKSDDTCFVLLQFLILLVDFQIWRDLICSSSVSNSSNHVVVSVSIERILGFELWIWEESI